MSEQQLISDLIEAGKRAIEGVVDRATSHVTALREGRMTVNQVRAAEGLPPIKEPGIILSVDVEALEQHPPLPSGWFTMPAELAPAVDRLKEGYPNPYPPVEFDQSRPTLRIERRPDLDETIVLPDDDVQPDVIAGE